MLFNEVLRGRPAWRRPVDSHPELVLRDALQRAGLQLATQPCPELPDGRTGLGGAVVVRLGTDEIDDRLGDLVAELVELHRLRRRDMAGVHAAWRLLLRRSGLSSLTPRQDGLQRRKSSATTFVRSWWSAV